MSFPQPKTCRIDVHAGALEGASGRYQKRLIDLEGVYADTNAFARAAADQGDRIVYEVSEVRPSANPGDMTFGVTRMDPGKIGDEFFVTRGHIHSVANRPEIYVGYAGKGLMLMESPEGEIEVVEIAPGILCYVPPYWIHRSVNTGDADLVMLFSYPSDSGQDYAIIEASGGMKCRIIEDGNGHWKSVPNPSYRARSRDEVARILSSADHPFQTDRSGNSS